MNEKCFRWVADDFLHCIICLSAQTRVIYQEETAKQMHVQINLFNIQCAHFLGVYVKYQKVLILSLERMHMF